MMSFAISSLSTGCFSNLYGITALTHLYRLRADTPNLAETSGLIMLESAWRTLNHSNYYPVFAMGSLLKLAL